MKRQVVRTDDAPAAIGPYSQAVLAGNLVFCSGQIALDPKSGEMIADDVEKETHQVMTNLAAVLRAAGTDMPSVIKCTIFFTDLGDFAAVNEIYGSYFPTEPPARACVEVSKLPKGAKVEIEAIASYRRV